VVVVVAIVSVISVIAATDGRAAAVARVRRRRRQTPLPPRRRLRPAFVDGLDDGRLVEQDDLRLGMPAVESMRKKDSVKYLHTKDVFPNKYLRYAIQYLIFKNYLPPRLPDGIPICIQKS
jgi:hypothetical protein